MYAMLSEKLLGTPEVPQMRTPFSHMNGESHLEFN